MKKFLLSLVAAAAALFATSCVNELEDGIKDNTGNGVTFEISASELASRALGDAEQAVYLLYGVYEIKDGNSVEFQNNLSNTTINDNLKFVDGNATVTINLLDDTSYNVLFWAVSAGTYADGITTTPAFTINWDEQTMRMNDSLEANVEGYDAFYGYSEGVAAGSNPEPVQLSRPFAQLNIGTNDLSIAAAGGFNPANSKVVLENAPKKFDLKNGTVTETGKITYGLASMNEVNNSRYPIGGYDYLSMNYVLVSGKALVNVTLEVNDGNNKTIDNTYNSVPVQRNYRTNVYGSLLTNGSQFNVTIDKGLSTEYEENHTIVKSGYQFVLALLRGENVILANDITVTAADIYAAENGTNPVMSRTNGSTPINVTINLGGHIITFADGAELDLDGGSVTIEGKGEIIANDNAGFDGDLYIKNSDVKTENYKNEITTSVNGLFAAFANGGEYTIGTSLELDAPLALGNGNELVLTFKNNAVLSIIDTTEKNFELIKNQGTLTIDGQGKLTVKATVNSGWNRYSAVIANTIGGNLTVKGVEIEHLGGTDMAYGIDNLTNGKGTSAKTIINGATVKSPYRAVRQFLNGIEAANELYVKAGVIEGGNKSIWMQDPSAKANTGKLVVEAAAELKGDVYLFVTAGSTEWPVEVSIAKAALVGDSEVLTGNVPAGYQLVETETEYYVAKEVAKIGETAYLSLQEAINAAEDGAEIDLISDIKQVDGVLIDNKNLTIDLNDKTYTVTDGANVNNRNIKVSGTSVVTIKNGTLVAEGQLTSGAYGTVRTEGSANVTLDNVKLYSYRGYGLNVKANTGTTVTINDSEIYAQYSGGIEAAGGTIELTNVKIDQKGVYSGAAWCSVAIGVNGGGKVTINSGEYNAETIATDANAAQGTWVAYVMSSGGTLDIKGGIFNGTIAETASAANACGLICADRAAVVNIYDGTFNSNGAILDMRNNVGTQPNPVATLYGGNYSANPTVSGLYSSNLITVAEGKAVVEGENGRWTIVDAE